MAAIRTYGIPAIIESREIFLFNGGQGKLAVKFSGGIPDPKFEIPATYSTDNEMEQMIIELSPQFNKRVFRYGPDGRIVEGTSSYAAKIALSSTEPKKEAGKPKKSSIVQPVVDDTKTYPRVETIGEATEILLDLGARADELNGKEAVMSAMLRMKVSFPNLKFD